MVGEAEVVVGAKVQHLAAVRQLNAGLLRPCQHPFALVETVLPQCFQFGCQVFAQCHVSLPSVLMMPM